MIAYGIRDPSDVINFVKLFFISGYSYEEVVQLFANLTIPKKELLALFLERMNQVYGIGNKSISVLDALDELVPDIETIGSEMEKEQTKKLFQNTEVYLKIIDKEDTSWEMSTMTSNK